VYRCLANTPAERIVVALMIIKADLYRAASFEQYLVSSPARRRYHCHEACVLILKRALWCHNGLSSLSEKQSKDGWSACCWASHAIQHRPPTGTTHEGNARDKMPIHMVPAWCWLADAAKRDSIALLRSCEVEIETRVLTAWPLTSRERLCVRVSVILVTHLWQWIGTNVYQILSLKFN